MQLSAGRKQRVVDAKGRNVGNIYTRLEEARKKRAKVLAAPKPANDAPPGQAKIPLVTAKAARTSLPDNDSLPAINPPPLVEPRRQPDRAKRRPVWQLAVIGAGIAGLLAYTLVPSGSPKVASDIPVALPPALSSVETTVSPAVWRDAGPRRRQTKPITTNHTPSALPIAEPTGSEPRVDGFRLITPLPPAAAQAPRPRPFVDPAEFRTIQPKALLTPPTVDTIADLALDARPDLRISLNVPSRTSSIVLATLRSDAENLGVDVGKPRIVNFPVKSTHVRYFHSTDKDGANVLASAIGANAKDFTYFKPQPPKGYVELWVAGRAKPAATGKNSGLRRDIRRLGSDIRNALRSISR